MINRGSENKKVSLFSNKLAAAKQYSMRGWIIHPVHAWNDLKVEEKARGKAPILKGWQNRERPATDEEIERWFKDTDYNIGLQTGKRSGVTVIDYDNDLFWSLLRNGIDLNTLESYRTEGRGHIYFQYTPEFKSKKYHILGIEILNDGNNAILPPSRHREGQIYRWRNPDAPLSPMPDELKARLRELFDAYEKLTAAMAEVRPCFRRLWNQGKPKPLHGGDGREAMAAWMLELRAHGCDLTAIKILARLVYRDEYDSEITTREWQNWRGNPWTCQKIRERLSGIISCEGCPLKERAEKEKTTEEKKKSKKEQTLTVDEIKAMEDWNGTGIISNYVIYRKIFEGEQRQFYVKVWFENGEVKEEWDPIAHSIPEETAPSVDFYKEKSDFKEVFEELRKLHKDYVQFANPIYPTLTALGAMCSYFREVFYTFPYFDFISGESECGKTTATKVMVFTSFYGTMTSTFSEAVLFREIDASHCFYGLDNIERLLAKPSEYASIIDWLLSSYSRDIPCRRTEKVGERHVVVRFDGYCEKAFNHIRDFPPQLAALKSRCIQIVMQRGRPKEVYPTPEKFRAIRDKLYNLRIREYGKVKDSYDELVNSKVLMGRTGDLFYPLLAIAKLISQEVYDEVLRFAKETEKERIEVDEWNKELVKLIYEEKLYGSISPADIRELYEERLRDAGLLQSDKRVHTRTITNKLKKLGYRRDNKTTDNKTWFIIDEDTTQDRAYEYGILNTPKKPNLVNLVNSDVDRDKSENPPEKSKGEKREGETAVGEGVLEIDESTYKLSKLDKLGKLGGISKLVSHRSVQGVCERCGKKTMLSYVWHHDSEQSLICEECAAELSGAGMIAPEYDDYFQAKQVKEASKVVKNE